MSKASAPTEATNRRVEGPLRGISTSILDTIGNTPLVRINSITRGVTEPTPEFSACFGSPFLPRHPSEYGALLKRLTAEHGVSCWLVNTGWTGGAYGTGKRMPIKATRALLSAALDGSLDKAEFRTDPWFGFAVPVAVPGIDGSILDPRSTTAVRYLGALPLACAEK